MQIHVSCQFAVLLCWFLAPSSSEVSYFTISYLSKLIKPFINQVMEYGDE